MGVVVASALLVAGPVVEVVIMLGVVVAGAMLTSPQWRQPLVPGVASMGGLRMSAIENADNRQWQSNWSWGRLPNWLVQGGRFMADRAANVPGGQQLTRATSRRSIMTLTSDLRSRRCDHESQNARSSWSISGDVEVLSVVRMGR
jgi:hypothetical protein